MIKILLQSIPSISNVRDLISNIGIPIIIGFIILLLVLSTLFLMLGLKAVEGQKRGFGAVFLTTILNLIVSVIPILGCILEWVIINARHKTGFGKAILVWLIAIIIPYVIVAIIVFATGIISTSIISSFWIIIN